MVEPASVPPDPEPVDLARTPRVELERFSPRELQDVCARYELGKITAIREFRRGSPQSPKVVIEAARGRFLLKRRSPRTGDPFRVAFVHGVQLFLAARGFATPRIIGTRDDNNSMLQRDGFVYELFSYVDGEMYTGRDSEVADAGRQLARLHALIADHRPDRVMPQASGRVGMDLIGSCAVVERMDKSFASAMARIKAAALAADEELNRSDLSRRDVLIVHGDWHPGNMIFRDAEVAAVLDFDSARYAPPIVEVANGLLQFSMTRQGADPLRWPLEPDERKVRMFWRGYRGGLPADAPLVPYLMIELLIAEGLRPIIETGRFGHLDALTCLRLVARKCQWLCENAGALAGVLAVES
ncbi:MAG: phosphotransferase [Phycisphaeraceae bacterium]|nr:phosphotransferase [Phycisphaeraceae bacterium]MCW5762067.1 phosphotransferase [Phycisphaeraceae bacterium]